SSCHQMTVDDDLASREVRLGYALYRDSLQYPSAGALIQALGMRDSAALHPNLQRHIIDDECVFLLCTDGLSDFDRIEQQWRHNVLPLLAGKQDIASAVKELITLANEKNGHDNVTVALVHCQINPVADTSQANISWSDLEYVLTEPTLWSERDRLDSTWTDLPASESPLSPTLIADEDESLAIKAQPKWIKSLIFFLLISTVVGLFSHTLLQNRLEDPDNNLPPSLPDSTETETEINIEE
ncbi:MAG: protein-serine/threonine phosphatase, partial [Cyanobacteria bacterium J06633_1]